MNEQLYYQYFGVIPFHTRGTAEGTILKYPDFFLKVYNGNGPEYIIQGYRYGDENPIFEDKIPFDHMREYGEQFKKSLH